MAQILEFNWKNPQTVAPVTITVGFAISKITVVDITVGNVYLWVAQMPAGEYLQVGTTGVQNTNGFTPFANQALFGCPITGYQAITPPLYFQGQGVNLFNFQVGDTILATDMAETGTGKTNNGLYTVSGISGNQVQIEGTATTGYKNYASGGFLVRVKDAQGNPVAQKNHAIYGGVIGTGMAGGGGSIMTCIVEGSMSVC